MSEKADRTTSVEKALTIYGEAVVTSGQIDRGDNSEAARANRIAAARAAVLAAHADAVEEAVQAERERGWVIVRADIGVRVINAVYHDDLRRALANEEPKLYRCWRPECKGAPEKNNEYPNGHGYGKCVERREERRRHADKELYMPGYPSWDRRSSIDRRVAQ